MATQVQWRRGTTAEVAVFTGAIGEIVVDTTTWQMSVQDGVTAGGHYTGSASGGSFHNATFTGSLTLSAVSPLQGTATSTATITGGTYVNPALTGTPTAPTQLVSDNSTRIATTAFVQTALTHDAPINIPMTMALSLAVNNSAGGT